MTIKQLRDDLAGLRGKEYAYLPADIERNILSCDRQIGSLTARIANPLPGDDVKDLKQRLAGYEATRKEFAGK